ncbi:TlpA family protein disulfide reductase [Peptoniphilus sp.]|jgi:thiol-disulfide isomerase/thioredoxin|uniref:TlpA family protein disulfide reductase n=1 Tax=Peptoniphilus sp. TaxID=1971214 RepID=UPI003D8FE220
MKKFLKIMLAFTLVLTLASCGKKNETNEANTNNKGNAENMAEATKMQDVGLNDFNFQTLDIKTGDMVDSKDFYGKKPLTFVNIWGTFCTPCIEEMEDLEKLHQKYKNDMNFLGVVSDTNATLDTNVEEALNILDKKGVTYTNIMPNPTMDDYMAKVSVIPTTLIVDKDGVVLGGFVGAMNFETWDATISHVLEENK